MMYSPSPQTTTNLGEIENEGERETCGSVDFVESWKGEQYLPSVGIVSDCLGIDFACSHVLDGHRKPLAVLDFCTWRRKKPEKRKDKTMIKDTAV